jgi:ribonuclease VapC
VIIVDTSAVIAILQDEPEAVAFLRCLSEADSACMSAVSFQEAAMVLAGRTKDAGAWRDLDALIATYAIAVLAYEEDQAMIARDAFLRFGKGRHPARLNCGDCASYALARKYSIPLLFKGGDFARTDIVPALPAPA